MNLILFRYLLKQFVLIFCATLFVLTAVMLLFDAIELLRSAAKLDHVSFWNVGVMALLKSPQMIHIILPFVILLSGLIFCFKLSRSSELIILRAIGLSVWNFILPLVIFTGVLGVFAITIFNPIAAGTARRYERLEEHFGFTASTPFSWSEEGFWLRETRANDTLVIRASRVRQEGDLVFLDNVSVFELNKQDIFERQNEAAVGVLEGDILTLENAFIIDTAAESGRTVKRLLFNTNLNLDRILEKFDEPQTMSFWRFPRFIRFLRESGFATRAHRMYWHELIAFPIFLIAMLLISTVFALPPTMRQGRFLLRVVLAILSGFLLYFLSRITNVLGLSESLPLVLAAWGPALIAIPLCLSALLHFEDG